MSECWNKYLTYKYFNGNVVLAETNIRGLGFKILGHLNRVTRKL